MLQHFTEKEFDDFLEGKLPKLRANGFNADWSGKRKASPEVSLDLMRTSGAFNSAWHGLCCLIGNKNIALDKVAALNALNALVDFYNAQQKIYDSLAEEEKC